MGAHLESEILSMNLAAQGRVSRKIPRKYELLTKSFCAPRLNSGSHWITIDLVPSSSTTLRFRGVYSPPPPPPPSACPSTDYTPPWQLASSLFLLEPPVQRDSPRPSTDSDTGVAQYFSPLVVSAVPTHLCFPEW